MQLLQLWANQPHVIFATGHDSPIARFPEMSANYSITSFNVSTYDKPRGGLVLFWHGICSYLSLLTTELGLIPPQGQTRLPDALNCQRLEKIVPRSDKAKLMVDPPRPPYLATLPSPGGLLFYLLVGPTSNHPGALPRNHTRLTPLEFIPLGCGILKNSENQLYFLSSHYPSRSVKVNQS